jgi:hypothetical protein
MPALPHISTSIIVNDLLEPRLDEAARRQTLRVR